MGEDKETLYRFTCLTETVYIFFDFFNDTYCETFFNQ